MGGPAAVLAREALAVPAPEVLAADHYILKKVSRFVLPYLIASRRLRWSRIAVVSALYAYVGDFGAMMAGLGIGAPLVSVANNGVKPGQNAVQAAASVLPPAWVPIGVVGLIAWGVIRLYVQQEQIAKRAVLVREFITAMEGLNFQLMKALDSEDPMPEVVNIQRKLEAKLEEAIDARIWLWRLLPEDKAFKRNLTKAIQKIREEQMDGWAPAPAGERRNG